MESPSDLPWPFHPRPHPDEALHSWILRLATDNHTTLQHALTGDPHDRTPLPATLTPDHYHHLAHVGGLPLPTLHALSVDPHDPHHTTPYASLLRTPTSTPKPQRLGARIVQHCPRCLAEDPVPYHRQAWCLDAVVACPHHGTLLHPACVACGVTWSPLDKQRVTPLATCPSCRADLRAHEAEPLPPALLERLTTFQHRLLTLHPATRVTLSHATHYQVTADRYARFTWHLLDFVDHYALYALFDPHAWDLRAREDRAALRKPTAHRRLALVATVAWCLEDLTLRLPDLAWRALSPHQYSEQRAPKQRLREDVRFRWLLHGLTSPNALDLEETLTTWFPVLRTPTDQDARKARADANPPAPHGDHPPFHLTDPQWAVAEPLVRTYGHLLTHGYGARAVVDGMLHVLATDGFYHRLPPGLPPATAVRKATPAWRASGALGAILTRLYEHLTRDARVDLGRHARDASRTPATHRALADAFLSPTLIEELRHLNPPLHRLLVRAYLERRQALQAAEPHPATR
ncbi:TniQ family protein [Deinococcus pimensis]|uniref:TniQ family protein n=1 Tax=Deinococcus pimensis TaxID=309888 RepID=UPI000489D603|nr:TniQ family protein [Deinococcus pimensis]